MIPVARRARLRRIGRDLAAQILADAADAMENRPGLTPEEDEYVREYLRNLGVYLRGSKA